MKAVAPFGKIATEMEKQAALAIATKAVPLVMRDLPHILLCQTVKIKTAIFR